MSWHSQLGSTDDEIFLPLLAVRNANGWNQVTHKILDSAVGNYIQGRYSLCRYWVNAGENVVLKICIIRKNDIQMGCCPAGEPVPRY
jgi:hypothetical protein